MVVNGHDIEYLCIEKADIPGMLAIVNKYNTFNMWT
jgi:hypothetical protein